MFKYLKFSVFFSFVQECPWYTQFLRPVIREAPRRSIVLDVGTGSGKLIQLLIRQKNVLGYGTDTNSSMLKEAQKKLVGLEYTLIQTLPGAKFPFDSCKFDTVILCNVLFNLPKTTQSFLLNESLRVLKKEGKILILNPSGQGTFLKLCKQLSSFLDLTIFVWFYTTKKSALSYESLASNNLFATKNKLMYEKHSIFNGLGTLEILEPL